MLKLEDKGTDICVSCLHKNVCRYSEEAKRVQEEAGKLVRSGSDIFCVLVSCRRFDCDIPVPKNITCDYGGRNAK